MEKRPDSFVELRKLKSYPTEVGSPNFSPDNIELFKLEKTQKLKHHYNSKFTDLQNQYQSLIDEIKLNERLYLAKNNFEPIPGKSYHLYIKESGEEFLSLISPKEWSGKFEFVGTYQFHSDGRWSKL